MYSAVLRVISYIIDDLTHSGMIRNLAPINGCHYYPAACFHYCHINVDYYNEKPKA
jgi:hypothetical protein